MTQRFFRWAFQVSSLGCLATLWLSGGCATTQFGPAVARYAEKTAVTNAAARHTTVSPYYRFNSVLLSDLDDALKIADVRTQRKMAAAVLRGANLLSQTSSANEIERMPADSRAELGRLGASSCDCDDSPEGRTFGCAALRAPAKNKYAHEEAALKATAGASDETIALQHRFSNLANAALQSDLRDVDLLPPLELQAKLQNMRDGVEDLPDDRGRSERKVLYAWAAPLTTRGIAKEEAKLPKKCLEKVKKTFDRIAVWRSSGGSADALIDRYAPVIGIEWPESRDYDADYDRIGAVKLSADGQHLEVHVAPMEPAIYAYTTVAKINGHRFRQLNYVWWFSERPAMTPDDPETGHIDGAMIRITLDANDTPMFIESTKNCGCSHEVFVSKAVESAARRTYGTPLSGKRFSVEKHFPDKHDTVVIHTFDPETNAGHPLVLSAAGYHEVYQIKLDASESMKGLAVVENRTYRLLDYDSLDRLPLPGGIGSMFGPDGLVHNAGRPEGFLLAPSGILSAGQPRKRGTQRVRWDDFLHDDPRLLEKTLRLPPLD